jgi:CheY-specific phosphatase CheX
VASESNARQASTPTAPITNDDLVRVTEAIWQSTVDLTPTHRADDRSADEPGHRTLDGIVHLMGDYKATVAVQMSYETASHLAVRLFKLGSSKPTAENLQEALGEITAMTGAHLKARLDRACTLSPPMVIQGIGYRVHVLRGHIVSRVVFDCDGHSFVVSVTAGT